MIIFLVIASRPLNPLRPLRFQLRGSHALNVSSPPSTSLRVTSSITLNLAGSATHLPPSPPSPHWRHSCHAVLQAADHVRDVSSRLLCAPPAAAQLPDCSYWIHVIPTFISDSSLSSGNRQSPSTEMTTRLSSSSFSHFSAVFFRL